MTPNDIALHLASIPPGHLVAALEEAEPEDVAALARIIARAQLVGEVERMGSPIQQLLRRGRATNAQ